MEQKKTGLFDKLLVYRQVAVVFGIYLFLSFAGCVMVVFRAAYTREIDFVFLIWNLFLTWIPLLLSITMSYVYTFSKRSMLRSFFMFAAGIVWIVFYPNAPYIITDFIHISGEKYYFATEQYGMSFFAWYDFVMISLFILTGFLLGFVSLYIIQRLIEDKFNRWIGWLFVVGILFLSSFGIYLGRFIRWNSWDIWFNPVALMNSILESFHRYAFSFTVTFGLFLFLIYIALYNLTYLNQQRVRVNSNNKELII